MTPPEKGIPEFRNIKINNVEVNGAKQAFYVNAYAEKPLDNFTWENITIEADESGLINHASHWEFNNVSLKTPEGRPVQLNNCTKVEQPGLIAFGQTTFTEEKSFESLEKQMARIIEGDSLQSIIPVNSKTKQALLKGDTTHVFSDTMQVYIVNKTNSSVKYYEPLGDGFYFSPVEISLKNNGS